MLEDFGCRFHHLGLACRAIDAEAGAWEQLGYRAEGDDVTDPIQRVHIRFLTGAGPRLELLAPAGVDSPLENYIARGQKIYHQAFSTPRLDALLQALEAHRCRRVADPAPAVAFGGRRVAFVIMRNMNLLEFVEED
jgi:methylmalonyl-CoA/ethylmalonyl-CoA epimerase